MNIMAKAREAHRTCKLCKGTGVLHGGDRCDNLTCQLLLIHEATLDRLEKLLAAIAVKGGTEHYPTAEAYHAASEAVNMHRRARTRQQEKIDMVLAGLTSLEEMVKDQRAAALIYDMKRFIAKEDK